MTDPIRAKIEEAKALGFTENQLAFLEALLPDVYHAGQSAAVDYIESNSGHWNESSYIVRDEVLEAARNAE